MDILFSHIFMPLLRTRREKEQARYGKVIIIKAAYHHKANKGAQMLIREIITHLYHSHKVYTLLLLY